MPNVGIRVEAMYTSDIRDMEDPHDDVAHDDVAHDDVAHDDVAHDDWFNLNIRSKRRPFSI